MINYFFFLFLHRCNVLCCRFSWSGLLVLLALLLQWLTFLMPRRIIKINRVSSHIAVKVPALRIQGVAGDVVRLHEPADVAAVRAVVHVIIPGVLIPFVPGEPVRVARSFYDRCDLHAEGFVIVP